MKKKCAAVLCYEERVLRFETPHARRSRRDVGLELVSGSDGIALAFPPDVAIALGAALMKLGLDAKRKGEGSRG